MKVSYKGDYAIKSLVYLSYIHNEESGRYVRLAEISKKQDIPLKFLEQIMLMLKNAGYVKSHRGKNGGYAVSRNPKEVTLGEVIRLVDGFLAPIACVSSSAHKFCDFENRCVLKPVWAEVNDSIKAIVDNITFDELARKEKILKENNTETSDYVI